jgi:hypothetical protein
MKWRPIETAPKDESRFLAYFPDAPEWYDYSVICWSARSTQWWGCSPAAAGIIDQYDPTHWMPLPEPPETEQPK